jgi:uncharacterized cofD-like protein
MKKYNIVTIGGGTGSFVLFSGLKKYPVNLAAVVSMVDDGGSTGILRDELGVLPPGDVRQCLVALSKSSNILRKLMNYRFEEGKLRGHSFGNLFLSALEKISGDFLKAVDAASKILNVKGEVIPVTNQDTDLYIKLKNGKILRGQHEINLNHSIEKIGIKKYYLRPRAKANPKALAKIREADLVIIGPGNYYCSILPNFIVEGISQAIIESKAKVILNCNLVSKKGHSERFSLDDYVDAISKLLGGDRINFVTYNKKKPNKKLRESYKRQGENLVEFIKSARKKRTYQIIQADLLSANIPIFSAADSISAIRSLIRHDSNKLAKVIMKIAKMAHRQQMLKRKKL